jgi:hypothetical protein
MVKIVRIHKARLFHSRPLNIFFTVLPRITYQNPNLFCKQGDAVKLQCNAIGYPEPRVKWINSDTKKIIANASVTSLKITGKRSEGSYCCHVTNQFGKGIMCTSVIVTGIYDI